MSDAAASSEFVVENLRAEHVLVVYPLIRAAAPSVARRDWARYARRVLAQRTPKHGVLVARRTTQRHPSGAVCYRADRRLGGGAILIAEHFVALELLCAERVIVALASGLDRVAAGLGCDRIRFVCGKANRPLLQALRAVGYGADDVVLSRPVGRLPMERSAGRA